MERGAGRAAVVPATVRVRVSVVIPARDERAALAGALDSVAAQRYPAAALECVVVDNGSCDGTGAVALAFADRHPELALRVVWEPTPGVAAAKNRGARAASGTVLLFLDADSRMDAGLVRAVAARYRAGCPAGSVRVVADSRDAIERGFFALMELGKLLFGIRTQMGYCERALFLAVGGFRPDLRLAEDLDFMQRVKDRARRLGLGEVCHIRTAAIATSPRRLRRLPAHLSVLTTFARWSLAFAGVWRTRAY